MADIFDEVTDELRQDLLEIFKKISKYLIISIALVILVVCAYKILEYNEK